jgi:CRISPR-associated protein Cas2
MLTGYRLMWVMVIFDLPVGTKPQRKAATRFRKFLLDQGFLMSQFSVYMRFCGGKDQAEAYTKRIQRALPTSGLVQILFFTDKQYESIISFEGRAQAPPHENPEQYAMF